ncbi:hypothetical protein [Gloeobacter violaceus]|uniref:hypothetical protein n=1 Tax=Gloeobacter violaceus TaxID=33072 RepID=UPI0013E8ED37|nr:hypothetical protein [Gloeobacter violaceus]
MNVKSWIYRNPLQFTGIAVVAGVLAGLALPAWQREERGPSPSSARTKQPEREKELIEKTGKNTLVASVMSNLATLALREGSRYVTRRFFGSSR